MVYGTARARGSENRRAERADWTVLLWWPAAACANGGRLIQRAQLASGGFALGVLPSVPLKTEPLLVGVPPVQETKFGDKIKSLPHQQKPESCAQLLCLTARTIF